VRRTSAQLNVEASTSALPAFGWLISEADLLGANLGDASLSGAFIGEADLSAVHGLSEGQTAETIGDAKTRLPQGFRRPAHWPAYEP
jgi:uncharacterized protein YjbI with pentapeptide repeats